MTLAVLISWYFSFVIVLVLPIDISGVRLRSILSASIVRPKPLSLPDHLRPLLVHFQRHKHHLLSAAFLRGKKCFGKFVEGRVLVQSGIDMVGTFHNCRQKSKDFSCRLLLPLTQSYINSGHFTVKSKLKSALLDNAIFYSMYLFICSVLLIYLATRPGK